MALEIFQEMIGPEMNLVVIVLGPLNGRALAAKRDVVPDRSQIFHV
jgi:hypothetical protein